MNFKIQRISLEQGLSQSIVYSIRQDSKGFMWFATQEGLNMFDGYKFTVFRNEHENENSPAESFVTAMHVDLSGDLWIGTHRGFISKYDSENNIFCNLILKSNMEEDVKETFISSITDLDDEYLIMGTYGNGLLKLNKKNFLFEFIRKNTDCENSLTGDFIYCLCNYEHGILSGVAGEGLCGYNTENKNFKSYKLVNPEDRNLHTARALYRDSDNNILIGTGSGIYVFDHEKNCVSDFDDYFGIENFSRGENIRSICEDKNRNLWLGTKNSGVIFVDRQNGISTIIGNDEKSTNGISNDFVISIYNDKSNVTWIGTYGGGICKIDCESKKFFHIPEIKDLKSNFTSNNILSFSEDNEGNIWIGTYGKGVFKVLGKNLHNLHYEHYLDKNAVWALTHDDKNLWAGVELEGLKMFDAGKNTFETNRFSQDSDNHIFSLLNDKKDPDRFLFVGTRFNGLLLFDKHKKTFVSPDASGRIKLNVEFVKSLLFDVNDKLWVGTKSGEGLFEIDFQKGEIINHYYDEDDPESLAHNHIMVLYQDSKENIWIGTDGRGLNKYDPGNNSFKKYTAEKGLSNNYIRGILEDKNNNLWISTNNGLSKFNLSNETFRIYDESDGLQSKEFNDGAFYKSKDGTFFFGGIQGFNFFRPEEIVDNPYIPDIVITDFQIFNHSIKNSPENPFLKKNITETEEINLSYRESVFSFEFAALSFNNPGKNQYAYMMEGFDKDWVYSGTRRFATYTNLEPGDYIFRVKGSNNDNIWNEEGAAININISPPFWKTWWFKTLAAASVVGATGLGYSKKLAKIEKAKKAQEDFSRLLLDSQAAERKKIATELHHTVAHDILITKNKAVLGIRKSKNTEEMKNVLNEISELASNTLNDVRSISYSLHPHQIEQLGMRKALQSMVKRVSSSTEINFTFTTDDIDKVLSEELELNLFRIIQECINNIMKHSEAKNASLTIKNDNRTLFISIYDDGKGISPERADGIGLTEIKESIKLYKGEFIIERVQPKGTLIAMTLPIINLKK